MKNEYLSHFRLLTKRITNGIINLLKLKFVKRYKIMPEKWTTTITSKRKWYNLNFAELFKYKDLIGLFVKRDFTAMYKQTILGPLWILLHPFLTTVLFTVVFGRIANIATDSLPQFLFYMSANIVWTHFSRVLTKTSQLYISNANLLKKVYFPRVSLCVTSNITSLMNFLIQFLMFIGFLLYFYFTKSNVFPNGYILLTPILLVIVSFTASGVGLMITAITAKYRDAAVLTSFGVQMWMYVTPVVYPISSVPPNLYNLFMINPMAPVTEAFRYAYLGAGVLSIEYLTLAFITSVVLLGLGLVMFNMSEKNFSDTL